MNTRLFSRLLTVTLGLTARPLWALTPAELDQKQKAKEALTVVDVRPTALYQRSHIPGAINLPADSIEGKKLPPLGKVVVYCDGLGLTDTKACVASLNAKPGITAESLEGGFAAWETFTNVTAAAANLRPLPELPAITYDQLKKLGGEEVTLIDVRKPAGQTANFDLTPFCRTCVPKARMTTRPFELLETMKTPRKEFSAAPALLVIIDNDDTSARTLAAKIQASGYKRVAVLAGGDEIIKREGKSGLARSGSAASITLPADRKPVPLPPSTPAPAPK